MGRIGAWIVAGCVAGLAGLGTRSQAQQVVPPPVELLDGILGGLAPVAVDWQPVTAPGSRIPAPSDARRIWTPQEWHKVPVPSGGHHRDWVASPQRLPDGWSGRRDYACAWYLLSFDVSEVCPPSLWFVADAVAQHAVVLLNGQEMARHLGGYTPFDVDLSSALRPGTNTLALWVQDATAVFDEASQRAVSQLGIGWPDRRPGRAGVLGSLRLEARPAVHLAKVRIIPSTRKQRLAVECHTRGDVAGASIRHEVFVWPDGREPVLAGTKLACSASSEIQREEIPWENPRLWSPDHPNLYILRTTLKTAGGTEVLDTRFGFREFWIEGKHFMLNGSPIRLRGPGNLRELNRVGPGVLEGNRALLQALKRDFHYNAVRLHAHVFPDEASLAADEAGYLVVNQSAIWSALRESYNRGADDLLKHLEPQFSAWYWRDVNKPSVVIWDVENEMLRNVGRWGSIGWALKLDEFIKQWDPSAIVQHSGAAWYAPDQEIVHVHMQEQYNRIMRDWCATGQVPLVLGEFWTGGRGETRLPNGYEFSGQEDWHVEEARIQRERMLEMRYYGVSGIMSLVLHGLAVESLEEATTSEGYRWRYPSLRQQGARGLAPVIGFVWPRSSSVAANRPFQREIVVCNDAETAQTMRMSLSYGAQRQTWSLSLAPTEQHRINVSLQPVPGIADLAVSVHDMAGQLLDEDRVPIHALDATQLAVPAMKRHLWLVPGADEPTRRALNALGVSYSESEKLPPGSYEVLVLVPPGANPDALGRNPAAVKRYLNEGGRLLVLAQDEAPRWLPVNVPFWSSVRSSDPDFTGAGWAPTNKDLMYSRELPVYAATHPVMQGLEPIDLREWDALDGRVADDAFVRPNAVSIDPGGAYRFLMGATRRENGSLWEARVGRGTALFCQLQVLNPRATPAAQALFFNMLRYLDGDGWAGRSAQIGLMGALNPALLSSLTGMDETQFKVVTGDEPWVPDLVLVGDRADAARVLAMAERGATAVVLSCAMARAMPGFEVAQDLPPYSGCRHGVVDDPLFWGVASASFLPLEHSPAKGVLSRIPEDADVLLGGQGGGSLKPVSMRIDLKGLETQNNTFPLVAARRVGSGRLMVTGIEPFDVRIDEHRQLLTTLLANAGASIPLREANPDRVAVERTIPLVFDGRLDDWTNEMEDKNVSAFARATPLALTSKDAVEGLVESDRDLSALLYLLHDTKCIYFGGVVFAPATNTVLTLFLDGHELSLDLHSKRATVNGLPSRHRPSFGMQQAQEFTDIRLLDLTRVNSRSGQSEIPSGTKGTVFEWAIPWEEIGESGPPSRAKALLRLSSHGAAVLQMPLPDGHTDNNLDLVFQP